MTKGEMPGSTVSREEVISVHFIYLIDFHG